MSPHHELIHRYALRLKGVKDADIEPALNLIEFFGIDLVPIDTYGERLDIVVGWVSWLPEDVF